MRFCRGNLPRAGILGLLIGLALFSASAGAQEGAKHAPGTEPATGIAAAPSGDIDPVRLRTAAEFLDKVYLRDAVRAWRSFLEAPQTISDGGAFANDEDRGRFQESWLAAVRKTFDENAIAASIRDEVARDMTDADLAAVNAFIETPLGHKIALLEKAPEKPEADQAKALRNLTRIATALKANPKRRALVMKIYDASGGAAQVVDSLLSVSLGTALGLVAVTPQGQPRLAIDDVIKAVEDQRAGLVVALEPMVFNTLALNYETLSLSELKTYTRQLATRPALKLRNAAMKGWTQAMRAQAIAIGTALGKDLAAQKI